MKGPVSGVSDLGEKDKHDYGNISDSEISDLSCLKKIYIYMLNQTNITVQVKDHFTWPTEQVI